jgi:predicted flap endonuclease-1-like 5' DNA nuclease
MYIIFQGFIYLALAIVIGGAIGYALRSCLTDTACDDVRDALVLSQSQYDMLSDQYEEHKRSAQIQPTSITAPNTAITNTANLSTLSSRELESAILASGNPKSPARRFAGDDLTAIKGISPRLDAWLATLNITRFEHLANLEAGELYWMVENAPENGSSIYRDQWLAQARAQMC